MTRRKFVKAAGVAGGMALLSRVMGNFDAHAANATRVKTDPILKDVCDSTFTQIQTQLPAC